MNRNAIAALTATTFLVAGCSGAPEQVTVTETVEAPEATEACLLYTSDAADE